MIAPKQQELMVGMGQIVAAGPPARLWSILGSCVAVALCDTGRRVAALGHVVLPAACGRQAAPGKYADTAVPEMVESLRALGVLRGSLTAKIAGGAKMFGHAMPQEVGENNVAAVTAALAAAGIALVAEHIGGTKGRRVTLDCATGQLRIEVIGQAAVTL